MDENWNTLFKIQHRELKATTKEFVQGLTDEDLRTLRATSARRIEDLKKKNGGLDDIYMMISLDVSVKMANKEIEKRAHTERTIKIVEEAKKQQRNKT